MRWPRVGVGCRWGLEGERVVVLRFCAECCGLGDPEELGVLVRQGGVIQDGRCEVFFKVGMIPQSPARLRMCSGEIMSICVDDAWYDLNAVIFFTGRCRSVDVHDFSPRARHGLLKHSHLNIVSMPSNPVLNQTSTHPSINSYIHLHFFPTF